MNRVILDQSSLMKLQALSESAEICDATGRVVGFFRPAIDGQTRLPNVPFTDEELDRFAVEPGGRALDEIIDDLETQA